MHSLTTWALIRKRVVNSRWLLASVFAGVIASMTLVSAVPVYMSSLAQLSLNLEIDNLGRFGTTAFVFANNLILTESRFAETDQIVGGSIDRNLLPAYAKRERFLTTHNLLVEIGPDRTEPGFDPPSAVIRHMSNLENYVTVLSGRNAESIVLTGPDGPIVEAVVSENVFELFGIGVGDEVIVGVAEEAPDRLTLRVVGIVDNSSFDGTLLSIAGGLLNPPTQFDPETGPPPLPLFVTEQAITDAIGPTFSGIVVDAIWFVQLEPEVLKTWTGAETLRRIDDFEREINTELPGANISTPLRRVINGAEARAFFARVPMLLLLTVLSVTVAFYLGMMVTYLVQSRGEDAALMRTRGVGFLGMLRIYSFEGLVVTVAAVVLSPLVAIGLVMAAGMFPSFSDLTDGGLLPFVPQIAPFVIAVIVGLICLSMIVIPSALMARRGVLSQRFQSARPPSISVFHRYYIDLLLLVLGGFVFWELQSRGELVSGGLFREVEINEALLFSPVLFLIVVALIFMRLFPLLVRYLGGESPALLHLATVAALAILLPGVVILGVRGDGAADWLAPATALALFGVVYWGVSKTTHTVYVAVGIVLQAVLLWGYYRFDPPDSGSLLFWPFVALAAVVVGQVAYIALKSFVRLAPVWVSMSLWHVARRPLQYTWLVVLVVLVTGVSILATTVGGTLEQSQLDRVHYQVAGDVRIAMSRQFTGGVSTFRDNSKVARAAEAIRTNGTVGSISVEVLGVDSDQFHLISWYRDDFSERPLDEVIAQLRPQAGSSRAVLPEGATSIGLWALPVEEYEGLMLNLLLSDAWGQLTTVFLGEVGGAPEWKLMTTEVPVWLRQPVSLKAVHLQEQGAFQQGGRRAGTILIDQIHATVGADDQTVVVEDFESSVFTWLPIIADPLAPDVLEPFEDVAYRGGRSARFTFGQATDRGVRGFYKAPTRQFLPVVFSERLLAESGLRLGEPVIIKLASRQIVVIIMDTVRYFPTMRGGNDKFIITDVDLLLGHLNVLSSAYYREPNEVFVRAFTDDNEAVRQLRDELNVSVFAQVTDRVSLLDETNISPAMTAGWRTLAVFSLVVAVVAAASGYVSYLLLSDEGRRTEVAFLQSMGLSRVQLIALIAFEQAAIIAIALGLGTWAGFQMSRLLVTPLAVSEAGGSVVPPFLLITDWTLLAPVYVALIMTFVASLIVVNWRALHVNLAAIARLEA